jgi:hypothetical protein
VPAAVIVGIWLSGWEDPGPYMMQGASTNPWVSGAGPAILLTLVVMLVLATLLWSWFFGDPPPQALVGQDRSEVQALPTPGINSDLRRPDQDTSLVRS